MFKKTLLAMAVAGVSASALAADIDTNTGTDTISYQGATSETNIGLPAGDIVIDLGAEYTTGDVFTLTFSGATIDTAASTITATYADDAGDNDTATLGVLNADATSVTVRITAMVDGNANAGIDTTDGSFTVGGLQFETADVLASASNKVVVTYAAQTAQGLTLDGSGDLSADIIQVANQFTGFNVATSFDGTIDVAQQRKGFDDPGTTDAASFSIENDSGAVTLDALIATGTDTVDYTLNGDFSFLNDTALDADEDGDVELAEIDGTAITVANGTLTAVDADYDSVSIEVDDADETPDVVTVTVDSDADADTVGDLVLEKTSFTVEALVNFDDNQANAGTTTVAATSAGAWGINGTIAHVPFFVNDNTHATIVTVANYSTQTPDVEIVLYDGTDSIESGVVGQAGANGVTNITAWVTAAAEAAGVSQFAFDVVVSEESNEIDVNAQYVNKSSGSRAVINVVED